MACTFITRPDLLHLLHAARHGPHTGTALKLASPHVGVDGSFKEVQGQKHAAGAVCFFTTARSMGGAQPGRLEARIITCMFDGDQTSVLSTRRDERHVPGPPGAERGARAVHRLGPPKRRELQCMPPWPRPDPAQGRRHTRPEREARGRGDDRKDAAAAAHYAHNPHMQRAQALTKRDHAAGLRRQVVHQAAHSLPDQDARVHTILSSTPGATVRWDPRRREYVVPPAALEELSSYFAATNGQGSQGAPQAGTAPHTRLVQNALADWGAKRVTVHGSAPSTHLSPNTLLRDRWMVVDAKGAIQQSDNRSLRRSVISRVASALVEQRVFRSPYLATKRDWTDTWVAESTHALTLASAGRRITVAPANEWHTRFCFQMLYGSSHYAKEATEHRSELAAVLIDGNSLDLSCPLCEQADSDTKHHLFHECAETHSARDAMQQNIADTIRAASARRIGAQAASDVASAATSRPDFYAGQIPQTAHDLLLAAKRGAEANGAGVKCGLPLPGTIQQTILKHCRAIHETRKALVDATIATADAQVPKLTSRRDVHAYRHALWGTAIHAARAEASQQPPQQAGPSHPQPQPLQPLRAPLSPQLRQQPPGGLSASLNSQYASLSMLDANVPGDGNCLLYAALGLSVDACAARPQQQLAAEVDRLRARVIQHARGLSAQLKCVLGVWRPGAAQPALSNPDGALVAAGQPARWSLDYQAVSGNFMTDNVLHSLAATLDSDIVVIRTDATGQICPALDHFHARQFQAAHFHARPWATAAAADARAPDGEPPLDAYSTVLWAGGRLTASLPAGQQERQTRAAAAASTASRTRQLTQQTLQQLIAQRHSEQRSVTLIYSNGGNYATGHFRAVVCAQQGV